MKIKHFLQLIRYKNLLLLVFMLLLFKFVFYNAIPPTEVFNIFLLIIAIISITASGNIINDIYDIDNDLINKPNKVIVGKYISKKKAFHLYYYFNILGILSGIYLSFVIDKKHFLFIFVAVILLLFYYSKYLKQIALVGNFLVSILISLSILMVYLFDEFNFIFSEDSPKLPYFLVYAFFAFILNFIREIVKDIEDIDGDYSQNMKTLPIVIGKKRTQNVAFALTIIPLFLSAYFAFVHFKNQYIMTLYILFFIIFPLGYFMYKILKATTKKGFHKLSTLLKIIMFLGMLSILLIKQLGF